MGGEPQTAKGERGGRPKTWLRKVRLILATVLIVLLLIFVFQNDDTVEVKFFFLGNWRPRVSLVMASAFAVGMIAGLIFRRVWSRKR